MIASSPIPLLSIDALSVDLGGAPVLDRVTFGVAAGETVGLLGPNGAGKSTILRAITRVARSSSGTIEVLGQRIEGFAPRELARVVAVVQQLPEAPPTMRVQELVALGRNPYLGLLDRESVRDYAVVQEAMRRSGCERLADRLLGTLSGGQRRRAFIARALAQEPRLLLLDEPTANLDVEAQCEIFELLCALATEGVGVLVVEHDITLAAAYCDRIVLLAAGRVVANGTPESVVTADVIRRTYGERVGVLVRPGYAPAVVPGRTMEVRRD